MTMSEMQAHHDAIIEKLDEIADLSEHWRRNREKGRHPNAIRTAMMMLAHEITMLARLQDRETAAYHETNSS